MEIPGESHHLPELDGVRGIAILAVLLAHGADFLHVLPIQHPAHTLSTMPYPLLLQGWGGVDLFFTLSGFLITGILLRSRSRTTYFSSFYMRRILRIFPVYYLFLIVSFGASFLTSWQALDIQHHWKWWLPYFFYIENWPVFWASWAGMLSLWGVYWSLAVEEQFYFIWPALVRIFSPRFMLVLCVCGFFLGAPERLSMMHLHGVQFGIMEWPFSRLDGLFLGAAIAFYRHLYGRPVPLRLGGLALGAGAAIYIWLLSAHRIEFFGSGLHIWGFGVTAFALMSAGLIITTQHRVALVNQVLTLSPLRIAGRLSYGMYVYHVIVYRLILSFLRAKIFPRFGETPSLFRGVLVISCSILIVTAIAELSFCFFETPFLRLKRFFPSPAPPVSQVST